MCAEVIQQNSAWMGGCSGAPGTAGTTKEIRAALGQVDCVKSEPSIGG